ncbi:MAG: hypothetical protein ACI4XL_10220 [Bacillus sp. (in: firmicutes)]
MKSYTVFLIQLMVWSGYTVAEWLSRHDRWVFKALMFVLFLQMALYIGNSILKAKSKTAIVTVTSLGVYGGIHLILGSIMAHT